MEESEGPMVGTSIYCGSGKNDRWGLRKARARDAFHFYPYDQQDAKTPPTLPKGNNTKCGLCILCICDTTAGLVRDRCLVRDRDHSGVAARATVVVAAGAGGSVDGHI